MKYIQSQFWEIERSAILSRLGALISVLHIINYFYWRAPLLSVQNTKAALCWDFFEGCLNHSLSSPAVSKKIMLFYILASVAALLFFIWQRFVRFSWGALLAASTFHLLLYISNVSLNSDIQSLLVFLNLTFLFVPGKALLVRFAVVAFYTILAYRELSPEWLSGAALTEAIPLPLKGLEWLVALGLIAKLTLPILLVSLHGQRVALASVILGAYHAILFYYLRDFTSLCLMLFILYFSIDYFARKKIELETLYQSYAHPEPSRLWTLTVVLIFFIIQTPLLPRTWPSYIMHIDGPPVAKECEHLTFAHYNGRFEQIESLNDSKDKSIQHCSPLYVFTQLKELCRKLDTSSEFRTLSSFFMSRKISEKNLKSIFAIEDVCASSMTYSKAVAP